MLRKNKYLSSKAAWAAFDFFFISLYQNSLVLLICLPALAAMDSEVSLNAIDYIAFGMALFFLIYETIADEQQMAFHTTKRRLLAEGRPLEQLPEPFNKGFNTTGLWAYSRHPNYLGEQMVWISLYLVVIGAGVASRYVFDWTIA